MVMPIFKISDYNKAVQFYVDWLGFKIDWQLEKKEENSIYLQISKGKITLHLTNNTSDNSPGKAFVEVEGVQRYYQQLVGKKVPFEKPVLGQSAWSELSMEVTDPFGNKLLFSEKVPFKATA